MSNAREQSPFFADDSVTLWHGDCLDVMAPLPDASVDAVVTDPPYGLEFMGKDWDRFSGAVTDRDFKGFVLSQQRTRNVKCPECGKWAYDHPGRLCECGGIRRAQGNAFQQWCEQWTAECLRVLKPGGYLLAFGGSRTWHRLTVAVEDAGFEVRDSIAWLYGSGFPKSLDVSKAIDKRGGNPDLAQEIGAAIKNARTSRRWTTGQADRHFCGGSTNWTWFEGRKGECRPPTPETFARIVAEWPELTSLAEKIAEVEGEVLGSVTHARSGGQDFAKIPGSTPTSRTMDVTAPATQAAARWSGWGTALKPAFEPIVVARKPLVGTVAANVLAHGTGALNVDGCRVDANGERFGGGAKGSSGFVDGYESGAGFVTSTAGRWPTNVVLDGHAADELDAQSGVLSSGANPTRRGSDKFRDAYGDFQGQEECTPARGADSGGASRFFPTFRYEAKAPTAERPRHGDVAHPTVKPLDLMRWLVRLVTPPGGTVLEPFAGSGTTAEACVIEGFRCIAIEREAAYLPLIVARLSKPIQPDLFGGAA